MFGTKAEPLLKVLCVVFDGVGMLRLSEVLHQPQNKQMFDLQHADMILKFKKKICLTETCDWWLRPLQAW